MQHSKVPVIRENHGNLISTRKKRFRTNTVAEEGLTQVLIRSYALVQQEVERQMQASQ